MPVMDTDTDTTEDPETEQLRRELAETRLLLRLALDALIADTEILQPG